MFLKHDSRCLEYRDPFGARPAGSSVLLRLRASQEIERAWVRAWLGEEEERFPMERRGRFFEAKIALPAKPGLFWYFFIAEDVGGRAVYYGNALDTLGGEGHVYAEEPPSFQITLYDPSYETPGWMHGCALYQIFPDRFRSSGKKDAEACLHPGCHYHGQWDEEPEVRLGEKDCEAVDFFGGDLRGIIEKLPYLKELGVECVYMNPIFRARSNHKYDTGDYMRVDPSFGTEEDLRELCEKAREMGIRVLLDGVFSHTGSLSRYFDADGSYGGLGAHAREDSPYASWYTFRHWPDDYECWWGFETLPNLNETAPTCREFFVDGEDSVTAHYLRAGASGWRLDVADELPMEFLRGLRERVKGVNPLGAVLGEVWEDASHKISYGEMRTYCAGDTLDGVMNYPLRDALLDFMTGRCDASALSRLLEAQRENYPPQFLFSCMNLLGSHDKPRAISVLSGEAGLEPPREMRRATRLSPLRYEMGRARYLAALTFVSALPGMPSVYYGDEAGLTGMADPFCRRPYPWGSEDEDLVRAVRRVLVGRKPVLRAGFSTVAALGDDLVLAARWLDHGRDRFGRPASGPSAALCLLNRSSAGKSVELSPGDVPGMPMARPVFLSAGAMAATLVYID